MRLPSLRQTQIGIAAFKVSQLCKSGPPQSFAVLPGLTLSRRSGDAAEIASRDPGIDAHSGIMPPIFAFHSTEQV